MSPIPSGGRAQRARGRTAAARYSNVGTDAESDALYNRSLDYLDGDGVPQDPRESFELNQRAANRGHSDAILAMGWYYLGGIGVERDVELAKKWYRKSARHGDARAMFSLGWIAHQQGQHEEEFEWFTRASKCGHARSLYWLGKLHWRGNGVPQDRKLAMRLFQEAANEKAVEAVRFLRFVSAVRGRRARHPSRGA